MHTTGRLWQMCSFFLYFVCACVIGIVISCLDVVVRQVLLLVRHRTRYRNELTAHCHPAVSGACILVYTVNVGVVILPRLAYTCYVRCTLCFVYGGSEPACRIDLRYRYGNTQTNKQTNKHTNKQTKHALCKVIRFIGRRCNDVICAIYVPALYMPCYRRGVM